MFYLKKFLFLGIRSLISVSASAAPFVSSDNVLDMLEDEGFTITKINEENCQF